MTKNFSEVLGTAIAVLLPVLVVVLPLLYGITSVLIPDFELEEFVFALAVPVIVAAAVAVLIVLIPVMFVRVDENGVVGGLLEGQVRWDEIDRVRLIGRLKYTRELQLHARGRWLSIRLYAFRDPKDLLELASEKLEWARPLELEPFRRERPAPSDG